MYYIKETEPGLFTVGCDQHGEWEPYQDCDKEEAELLVNKLNGGNFEEAGENTRRSMAWQIYLACYHSGLLDAAKALQRTKEALEKFEKTNW